MISSNHFATPITALLRCNSAIPNCFGYLDNLRGADPSVHLDLNASTTHDCYGFFRVCPLLSDPNSFVPIVVQVHLANKHLSSLPADTANWGCSPILRLNEYFANANGLKDGQGLILHSLPGITVPHCESVEIFPLGSHDWDTVVDSATVVEELFLGQLRLVQPGMHFCLHLNHGRRRRVARFLIGDNVLPRPSNSKPMALLLTMGTRVLVAPSAEERSATEQIPPETCREVEGEEEDLEDNDTIQSYLLPHDQQSMLRVLPDPDADLPPNSSHNPFFAHQLGLSLLLNSIPFIFALQMDDRQGNDTSSGRNSLRKWCVQVEDHSTAILVELPKRATEMAQPLIGQCWDRIYAALESLPADSNPLLSLWQFHHRSLRLRHCWVSPALRRALSPPIDLCWLRIRPLRPDQLRLISRISVFPADPDLLGPTRTAFAQLVAASREMHTPWLFPGGGKDEWTVKLGESEEGRSIEARVVVAEPTTAEMERGLSRSAAEEHHGRIPYIWPLSAQLRFDRKNQDDQEKRDEEEQKALDKDEKDQEERAKEEEEKKEAEMEVPPQQELLPMLEHFLLCSFFKKCLWHSSAPMPTALLLEGPVGSGKSTLLALLAKRLMRLETDRSGFVPVATRIVDLSQRSFARLINALEDAMGFLSAHWPSALLLDNFDAFAEKLMADSDEQNGVVRVRKVYQRFFAVIFGDGDQRCKVPMICTVREDSKLAEALLFPRGEGQALFAGKHRIRAMKSQEQLEMLDKLIARWSGRGVGLQQRVAQLGTTLNFGTIGELCRVAEQLLLRMTHRQKDLSPDEYHSMFTDSIRAASSICKRNELGEGQIPITFEQIAGLETIKKRLEEVFKWPNKYPDLFAQSGVRIGQRAILYGPSGCGKSMLIRALANEMDVNVISVRGPQLLSKYIGQSEQNVRQLFARAKACRPALIIFDEFDALAPQRGSDNAHVTDRVVNQLLTELDGFEEDAEGLFLIAATNRIDLIDRALLRAGRIDHKLFVGLPDMEKRLAILRLCCSDQLGIHLSDNVNLGLIAQQTEGWSGAEVRAIVQNALWEAKKEKEKRKEKEEGKEEKGEEEKEEKGERICQRHLQIAVDQQDGRKRHRREKKDEERGGRGGGGNRRMRRKREEEEEEGEPKQRVTLK